MGFREIPSDIGMIGDKQEGLGDKKRGSIKPLIRMFTKWGQ